MSGQSASVHDLTLDDLLMDCPDCTPTGDVAPSAHTVYPVTLGYARCDRCNGTKRTVTPLGETLLRFLNHHTVRNIKNLARFHR